MDFLKRIRQRVGEHNLSMVAAGVAFYAMLALFPALIAVVAIYALVSDPSHVQEQLDPVVRAVPSDVGSLLDERVKNAVDAKRGGLTVGLVASLLGTLWAASGGVNALTRGLAIIQGTPPGGSLVRRRLMSIGLTLGALVAAAVALALITVFPVVLGHVGLGRGGRVGVEVLRWLLLLVLVVAALAIVYRVGGPRSANRWGFVSWGVGVAMAVWILGSVGFSVYVSNFGRYNQTYGGLAAVIVLLLWLYLSSYAVLLGAVVDDELCVGRAARSEGPKVS